MRLEFPRVAWIGSVFLRIFGDSSGHLWILWKGLHSPFLNPLNISRPARNKRSRSPGYLRRRRKKRETSSKPHKKSLSLSSPNPTRKATLEEEEDLQKSPRDLSKAPLALLGDIRAPWGYLRIQESQGPRGERKSEKPVT
ncbi:hypothetical protein KM043_001110 [Ampulex compressa]|nr:hypothetical protein KM043_001110 [Ampulex compressa]